MKTQTKALVKKNLKGLLKFVAFLGIFVLIFTQLSIVFDPKDGKDKTGLSRNVSYSYRAEGMLMCSMSSLSAIQMLTERSTQFSFGRINKLPPALSASR